MRRDFEFFAVGAAMCRALVWEIHDASNGTLIARLDPGAASFPYHFSYDGLFRVRAIAVLFDETLVTMEHMVDTRRDADRDIDFHICATSPLAPQSGWEDKAKDRTNDNLKGVFG